MRGRVGLTAVVFVLGALASVAVSRGAVDTTPTLPLTATVATTDARLAPGYTADDAVDHELIPLLLPREHAASARGSRLRHSAAQRVTSQPAGRPFKFAALANSFLPQIAASGRD